MNENIPDPFEVIRREAVPGEPSDDDIHRARQRLKSAILREHARGNQSIRRWLVPSLATVILVALVGGVVILRPTPAEAALAEVAEAARAATPLEIPRNSFIYTRSERVDLAIRPGTEFELDEEFVAYLLPSTREVWRQPETGFIQIHTINHDPTFFDQAAEAAYYSLGLDATDRLGETQTEELTDAVDPLLEVDWPTDPDALHEALLQYASQGGDVRPEPVQVFDLATDLLREADPPPELRAAIVEVIARLPVELGERSGRAIPIGITYTTPVPTRDTIILSPDGILLAESSTLLEGDPDLDIPADITILDVAYLESRLTDSL